MAKSFTSVQISNVAAMIRMALQTATVFASMKWIYDNAVSSDEATLNSFVSSEVSGFDTPAIVNTLQKAIDYVFLTDISGQAWKMYLRNVQNNVQQVGLQKAIATYLASEKCNFNASEFLSKRMQRWRSSVSEAGKEWWDFCGPFIAQLCRNELVGAPQCVVAAYLKTVLNGWASARRLRLQDQCRVFGCGSKLDCIEHYLNCKVVRDIWERIEGTIWGPFESRLAVGDTNLRGRIVRVFFLYGLFSTYNARYNMSTVWCIEVFVQAVRSKITYALGKSSREIRLLHEEWSRNTVGRTLDANAAVGQFLFSFRKRERARVSAGSAKRNRTNTAKRHCKGFD